LFRASRGQIDPFKLNQREFEQILTKHSNLLDLGNKYNKRATNLIDIFQTMINAIIDKLKEKSGMEKHSHESKYKKPLSMQIP